MEYFKYILLLVVFVSQSGFAGRYWPEKLNDWHIYLNNGVAYIRSPDMAEHCTYDRAQINMTGTEFDKALYAYALSAFAKGKKLEYVVDSDQTICVISGLREAD